MAFRNSYPIYRWQLCAGSCEKPGNVKFDEGTQKNDITKQTPQDEFRGKLQLGKMMSTGEGDATPSGMVVVCAWLFHELTVKETAEPYTEGCSMTMKWDESPPDKLQFPWMMGREITACD
ncbi:hypothetical protein JTB14_035591 [Gonioctena quinquepunctata]|nr:hypothetical protein JTB14_035591 [Gonioctena quinquepunctata]